MVRFESRRRSEASPEALWEVLCALDGWARWNTISAQAPLGLEVGRPLKVGIRLGAGRRLPATATLLEVEPARALVWRGGPPGLFRAVHGFRIEARPEGSELIHFEEFRGLLVRPVLLALGPDQGANYGAVNEALVAEALARAPAAGD